MPVAPSYACPVPGCPHRQPCPAHTRESRQSRPNADIRRWYRVAKWRDPVWGRRAQCLRRDLLCVECQKVGRLEPATEVDHIVPHQGDAELFWAPTNLQGLCRWCHARKSGHEQGGAGARR